MELKDFLQDVNSKIVIIGTNALIPDLEQSADLFAKLMTLKKDLSLIIICESDSENFNQSLCLDTVHSNNRISYSSLAVHHKRILGQTPKGEEPRDGLVFDILQKAKPELRKTIEERISIKQGNLRMPVNLLLADSKVWCSITTNTRPLLASYTLIEDEQLRAQMLDFVDFCIDDAKGGVYLSTPDEELIQLYDRQNIPRGIYPRSSFYTTQFKRYSFWGFIFNRKGKLLLHKRGEKTKDGRNLWDKSIGGHVDLRDPSSIETAQREMVEELFLPKAEYTKYMRADLGDIINMGDWYTLKRPERSFREAFQSIGKDDWALFRATDEKGDPLTVDRVSQRRIHDDDDRVTMRKTIFISDIYLFVAPEGLLDTEEQMVKLLQHAEREGAGSAHELVSLDELRDKIEGVDQEGKDAMEVYTDDLLYINTELRGLLEAFSEFVKYVARG